jgi:hypothetical protein
MDHFNAMFEDHATKSWWYQATGEAIAGPLKGKSLEELPSKQTTLGAWLDQYPNSLIMQPDTTFNKQYKELVQYDNGTLKSSLEKRDSLSWKNKSWVIGIKHGDYSSAYDWNQLISEKIIQDSLPGLPIIIALSKDSVNFNVWTRIVNGTVLYFDPHQVHDTLTDLTTGSRWNSVGVCVDGPLKGRSLQPVQAYQEFWHSWKNFHPNTKTFTGQP